MNYESASGTKVLILLAVMVQHGGCENSMAETEVTEHDGSAYGVKLIIR